MRIIIVVLLFVTSFSWGQQSSIIDKKSLYHPVIGRYGMVASQDAIASSVGLEILQRGGNAIDAAVAVGFALAVTLPKAGNLGGGGFMLVYLAEENKTVAIDYREMAPSSASVNMFLNKSGDVDIDLSRNSYQSAGVPGSVAGLLNALKRFGTMSVSEVLQPAIKLASSGFVISHDLANELEQRHQQLSRSKAGKNIFYKSGGGFYQAGDKLVQKDLAWSLKQIAAHGRAAFYQGEIAKRIVDDMKKNNGLIDLDDLNQYTIAERIPVRGSYRGYDIVSMPPPSSGGVHIIQMLNILERFDLSKMGHNSSAYLHTLAETMKLAFADRSRYLGDPDFIDMPLQALVTKKYASTLASSISPKRATPSATIKPGQHLLLESPDTTHFSVADRHGNIVSNTYTLNFSYGSGIVIEGTGILLNNEMDDFSAKPGVENAFGLIGGEANAIQPKKRPLSSMSPTIVFKDDKPFLVVGSPGGSKIINVVLQIILNVIDHKMNIAEASSVPRIHHQWLPDQLDVERGISPDTIKLLQQKGHGVEASRALGSGQSILLEGGYLYGSSDPRRPGAKTLGY